ncbi:TRAP transporter small permease subunit [Radicibacter daui]|uniref:TRAP transporter small permease subunit n=1 Tax=Radicibacter daui TaxID=3064829 RepID=UPI004046E304
MAERLLAGLRRANRWVVLAVGLVLFACAAFVLADIILRKTGSSLGGTDEISGYVMAIATSWGMAFALTELAHVRIDVLRARVGALGRSLFDLFSMIVLSASVTFIAVKCWPVVAQTLANSSRANTALETPLWLVQVPWFAGWVWFACVAWLTLFAALILVLRGEFEKSESAIGAFAEQENAL